jgi:Protein of unknown function (DUF2783)
MNTMPFEDLEQAYETLASAIDAAGVASEAQFFARLVLLLAHELGDIERFKSAVAAALDGLPEARS